MMKQCCFHISTEAPGGPIPDEVIPGTEEEERRWLHRSAVAEVTDSMFAIFAMFSMFKELDGADGVREPSEKTHFHAGWQVMRRCAHIPSHGRSMNMHALTHHASMTDSSTQTM